MADPKEINDELRESIDLSQKLKDLFRDQALALSKNEDISNVLKNLQNEIVKSTKSENNEKQKIVNIQKEISDLYSEISEKVKNGSADEDNILEILNKIVEKKKEELNLAQNLTIKESLMAKGVDLLNSIGLEKTVGLFKEFNKDLETSPITAVFGLMVTLFKQFKTLFEAVDGAASDFRISMGFIRTDTTVLEQNVRDTYFRLAQIGLEAKDLYGSFEAIAGTIGTTQAATSGMVSDMAMLNVSLGVAQTTSAEFARTMGMMGKSTMDAQRDISIFVSRLSAAGGTKLNAVMDDVAKATQASYQFMTRSPLALAKAAVEAQRLGTTLSSAASSAAKLVDFTNSVTAEMEASVLLGESINLQRARELSYRKDLKGLNAEILNIAQKAKFEELDPFQQDAVAKALGKSADELGKMLQADREMRRIRSDGSLAKEVAEYDRLKNLNEGLVKSEAERNRETLRTLSNQQAIKAVSTALKSIYQTMFQPWVDLAAIVLPKISTGLSYINEHTSKWVGSVLSLAAVFGIIIGSRGLGRIVSWAAGGVGKSINSLMGGVSSGVKTFGDSSVIRGALGLAIVAASLIPLAFALKLMQGVDWKTFKIMAASLGILVAATAALGLLMFTGIGEAILIGAVALGILGLTLIPVAFSIKIFAQAVDMLDKVNLGRVAEGIAELSVSLLKLAIIAPMFPIMSIGMAGFGIALRSISGPMERVGISSIQLGMGLEKMADALGRIADLSLITLIKQFKDLSVVIGEMNEVVNNIPDIKIEKIQDIMIKSAQISIQQNDKSNDEIIKALQDIKASVDSLKSSLEKGGISSNVFIDAQRLDSSTARALAFKGTLSPQPSYG